MDQSHEAQVPKTVEVRATGTDLPSVPDIRREDHAVSHVSTERRNTGARKKSTVGGWTNEEDARLEEAVREYNGKNWKMIAMKLPGRTDVQCSHRWQKVLNPNLVKGRWTKEEDALAVGLVAQHGEKQWSLIAKSLPGRIGKQCRERWNNYLKHWLIRTPWTQQEDSILIEAHRQFGNKWAELTKLLPGRSENAIKNHWNCTLSKRVSSRNNGKTTLASDSSYYGGLELKNSGEEARSQVIDVGDIDFHSSLSTMSQNVAAVVRDQTTESASRDCQSEQAEVTAPVEESTSRMCLDLFDSRERLNTAHTDSSSGVILDFISGAVTESSTSLSTPLQDSRSSLEVSCPESFLRSAAHSFQNFPSIIRKRNSQAATATTATDTEKDGSSGPDSKHDPGSSSLVPKKRAAASSIMLFGKRLECKCADDI